MGDIIFGIVMAGCLLIPALIFKQWWLFLVFLIFGICFGLVEWLAVAKTGKTVSQHFWAFSTEHKGNALVVLGSMLLAWVSLLVHLGWKMFKKKEEE